MCVCVLREGIKYTYTCSTHVCQLVICVCNGPTVLIVSSFVCVH